MLSLLFGGLGTGTIVSAYFLALCGGISRGDLIFPDLTGGTLVALGLACVWAPVGGRLRTIAMLRRYRSPWVAYETYAAAAFFVALAVLAQVATPASEFCVAATAALMLGCQAYTIRGGKSRTAWRAPELPSLIVIIGLTTGTGLIALLSATMPLIFRGYLLTPIAGATLAAMCGYRWREYVEGTTDESVRGEIARAGLAYGAIYLVPLALYLAALSPWRNADWILGTAGIAAIVAGALWLQLLIARLGRVQDFTASPIAL
jgi:hypothetical protein